MKEASGRRGGRWTRRKLREQLQSRGDLTGIKLVLAWMVLGMLMLIGFFVGLVFLLLGWILMPLLRYGWVKRAHRHGPYSRGAGSRGAGEQTEPCNQSKSNSSINNSARVIEGEYQVRSSHRAE